MEFFQRIVGTLEYYTWSFGPTIGGESIPVIVVALLGTGLFLTLRLAFYSSGAWAMGLRSPPENTMIRVSRETSRTSRL